MRSRLTTTDHDANFAKAVALADPGMLLLMRETIDRTIESREAKAAAAAIKSAHGNDEESRWRRTTELWNQFTRDSLVDDCRPFRLQ